MLRCNVSYRLIGGRVSRCRAPLTFSHLTTKGTCYICLRPHVRARNSSSRRPLAPPSACFLGRHRNGSRSASAAARLLTVSAKTIDHLPPPLRHKLPLII